MLGLQLFDRLLLEGVCICQGSFGTFGANARSSLSSLVLFKKLQEMGHNDHGYKPRHGRWHAVMTRYLKHQKLANMTLRLSTRISIKWADDAPSEPTDTIVLSVGDYFMDLRITKADQSIDWAFAGTREILSRDPRKLQVVSVGLSNSA